MDRKSFGCGFVVGAVATVLAVWALAAHVSRVSREGVPAAAFENCPKDGDARVTNLLEPIRKKHKVPALCAAIVTSKGVECVGAVGVRKIGTDVPVTVNDQWHLGSDTKAMTAALAGALVEDGRLRWDSTLGGIFPELAASMKPDLRDATLRGARGERALLGAETYSKLHTPPFGGDYALGWLVAEREWGGGTVMNHAGCNTMNFANVWVAPKRDFAILACVNSGTDEAFKATDEAVGALMALVPKK